MLSCDINNTASNNYRSTARKVVKHSNRKMRRDWEPSRFQNHRIMQAMQKRKLRKKIKSIIRKTIPKSLSMFMLMLLKLQGLLP